MEHTPRNNTVTSVNNEQRNRNPWYRNNYLLFALINVAFVAVFYGTLWGLLVSTLKSEYLTYIPFIPVITAYLLFTERKRIFQQKLSFDPAGLIVAGAGIMILLTFRDVPAIAEPSMQKAFEVGMAISTWIGIFIYCFGKAAFRSALFPLLFLFFAVPIPDKGLAMIISILQKGSTEVSYALISLSGLPIAREGFIFHLPSLDVEVAPQCSGIRSALSLIVTGSLAGYLFLTKGWSRTILMLTLLPITIIKNGFRITSLTVIGAYIDRRILDSDLHTRGGLLFFILALLLVGGVIAILRAYEKRGPAVPAVRP